MAGVVTVGTAIAKMDDWTNLNNRLRLVTTSQKALNVAMQDTFDIAQRSGAAWGGTATIYQKIQYNSEKLGLSQEKVAKITESISKSISNSGSSAQAASAALYQLGQSFDKSSLNGDEFVSMSENAGYLMEVFAKGLGVTRAELKEMSSQGLLTTDKMVQAIEKMSGSIEEDFGKTNFTIGQSFTQLSNAVTKFVGESGQAKFFQVKQDIELQYSNGEIQRRTEHEKKLADIQSHFSGETYTKLERQENERFANENRLAELQFDSNVKGWNWAEDQKLKHQAEVNRIQISLSTELNDIQKQLAKESIDDQLAYELKEFKKVQDIKRQTAFDNINNPIYSMRDKVVEAQAQASMTPVQYQTWQLNKVQQDGYVGLGSDLIDSANAINENQILSEQEKYDQLKSAHEDYVNSKASLDLLYDKQTKDLARSQQEEQINMWGGILSTTQNTFSQLAQSAKDGAGEQSSVYRTMFAMQQAFSIASSMVAAYTAYSTAFADPSAMTLTQKFAGGAAVMAALMPAITSISSISLKGMAHNGIDNIPSEGTWLLDGGERVLNPQQNKDLTNYLANSKSQGPNIVINNNGSSKVSATQGADGKTYITIDELPGLIAGQLRNPNSQISKSVQHNTTATRRR